MKVLASWVAYPTSPRLLFAMSLENHADVPREYGKSLCACVPCRLVKTFDQVSAAVNEVPDLLQRSLTNVVCITSSEDNTCVPGPFTVTSTG